MATFKMIDHQVGLFGEMRPHGDLLRASLNSQALTCEQCGPLPDPSPGWIGLCHDAMNHVSETGHRVAVQEVSAAIYGPQPDHKPQEADPCQT